MANLENPRSQGDGAKARRWFACAVVIAAVVVVVVGYLTWGALSNGYSDSGTHPQSLQTIQFIVAAVSLLPAGGAAATLVPWRPRLFAGWLTVAVLTFAAWGVLNDAAVHGWRRF